MSFCRGQRSIALLLAAFAFAFAFAGPLAAASPGAEQPPRPAAAREDPPWLKEFVAKRIVYSVPGMEQVKVRKDVVYKRAGGEELKADVYSPADARAGARRPAVLFLHGGRIPPNLLTTPKDWAVYVSFGQLVAASGFVGVTFNHRFYAWESLGEAQSDVDDMIAFVRAHADELGVDRDRITLWAVSAGGIFLAPALRLAPPHIRSLVAYYPVLELRREEAPASVTDEALREHSPLHQLPADGKRVPPLFLARAGLDDAALNASLDKFVQAALARNLTLDLANHPAGHHGFDIEDNDDRSREILARTLEFLRTHG
jgi:acetyl esterase/lipase